MCKTEIIQHRLTAVIATKGPYQFSHHIQNILSEVFMLLLYSASHRPTANSKPSAVREQLCTSCSPNASVKAALINIFIWINDYVHCQRDKEANQQKIIVHSAVSISSFKPFSSLFSSLFWFFRSQIHSI